MSDSQTPPTEQSRRTDAVPDDDTASDGGYERAPEDFESDIQVDDATVPDHPVVVEVPGKGEASAKLIQQAYLDDLRLEAEEGNDAAAFGAEAIVRALKEHYVSPSFDGLTVEDYRASPAGYYDPFFEAIAPAMGEDLEEGN